MKELNKNENMERICDKNNFGALPPGLRSVVFSASGIECIGPLNLSSLDYNKVILIYYRILMSSLLLLRRQRLLSQCKQVKDGLYYTSLKYFSLYNEIKIIYGTYE